MPLEAAAVRATRATRRPAAAAAAASRDFSASAARETKLKTHQGAAKRWKAVGNGSFKRAQAGKQHLNSGFAPSRINALSQTVYSNHTQTKTLRRLIPYSARRSITTEACTAPVPDRAVLEVSGPDAPKFLKGLTSRDVEPLGGGYSGFLNATGRVLHDVFIHPTTTQRPASATSTAGTSTSYLIEYPTGPAAAGAEGTAHPFPLPGHLRKFILRSRVRVRDASDDYAVHAAWGGEADDAHAECTWKMGSGGSAEPGWVVSAKAGGEGAVGCWDLRAGTGREGMGRRLLVRRGERGPAAADHDPASELDYLFRRMLLGVPEGAQEIIPGTALPLESCMDVMGGIDFRKGCYVGQELTVRTYHTGHTRKRIMPLRFLPGSADGAASTPLPPHVPATWSDLALAAPAPGSPITYVPAPDAATQRPKVAVKVLAVHPVHAIGLGLMRVELVERRWGAAEWGTAVPPELVQMSERGSLRTQEGLEVWAGRGRGWCTQAEAQVAGAS